MTYIIKYKWALIGTFFLHIGVMAYMTKVKLERHYVPLGKVEQIALVLEDENDKPIEINDPNQALQNGKISNLDINEKDKVGESDKKYDARNFKNLDSDVEKDLKDFEKNAFNDLSAKHKNTVEVNSNEKDKKVDKTDENNNSETNKVRSGGRVASSYDFNGRVHETIAKPAYVCKGTGTIVLKVKLNRSGKVVSAEIDNSQSNFTEECMGENAVKYARKCKFEAGTQWPEPQEGTVTYTYISQ